MQIEEMTEEEGRGQKGIHGGSSSLNTQKISPHPQAPLTSIHVNSAPTPQLYSKATIN
jgi:hypothetical protein